MKFDDLRSSWKETNKKPLSFEEREQLVTKVCRQVEQLSSTLFRRDLIETIAAIAAIIAFLPLFGKPGIIVAKIGAATIIGGAAYIIYKMHHTRTITQRPALDAPLREFCEIEIERLDQQIALLRSVVSWYLAPIIIGVNLVFSGLVGFAGIGQGYCIMTLLLAAFIYWLNQRAVAKTLLPMKEELTKLLDDMNEST